MINILDASVALKWFAPDGDATDAAAERILRDIVAYPKRFIVPELFFYEMLSVLCRRLRQGGEVQKAHARLVRLGLRRVQLDDRLARKAARLAFNRKISGYDACYAALAVEFDGVWLTFDRAAHERLAGTGVSRIPEI